LLAAWVKLAASATSTKARIWRRSGKSAGMKGIHGLVGNPSAFNVPDYSGWHASG
jgi:hypothetical protein